MSLPNYTPEELIEFESSVAQAFNEAKIKAPVHLYSGNEKAIIQIFKNIHPEDWVFCSWRSHYQCLLKGVSKNDLMKKILEGFSIALCFPEKKIYSSAIVGGILPIAVGTALAIKRRKGKNKVFCFLGDMTSETGIAHEAIKFSRNHKLPIKFIIEDNNKSVLSDTRKVWNMERLTFDDMNDEYVFHYKYENKYPHAGAGVRVQF